MEEWKTEIVRRTLYFKRPARTSRGEYLVRHVWYVKAALSTSPDVWGVGECAPLPGLSPEAGPGYERILYDACARLEREGALPRAALRDKPSVLFGLETAMRQARHGSPALWDTPFSRGQAGITVNGLVWMGSREEMLNQIEEKLALGFRCLKLKIGAIAFAEELSLLEHVRKRFDAGQVELRVDANGAFAAGQSLELLKLLSFLDIHSIEQPVAAGQRQAMAELAAKSPLPIALDEELIGVNDPCEKAALLDAIRPGYLVLKPTLHGGWSGCEEWIELAEQRGTGWWITSALESNIGLNAIAQWTASLETTMAQGLGTGALFDNNVPTPLHLEGDSLRFNPLAEAGYAGL